MSLIVFIFHFQLILPRLRNKILYDKQQTPERQRCQDVEFIDIRKQYRSNAG